MLRSARVSSAESQHHQTSLDPVRWAELTQHLKLKECKEIPEHWEYFLVVLRRTGILSSAAPPPHKQRILCVSIFTGLSHLKNMVNQTCVSISRQRKQPIFRGTAFINTKIDQKKSSLCLANQSCWKRSTRSLCKVIWTVQYTRHLDLKFCPSVVAMHLHRGHTYTEERTTF